MILGFLISSFMSLYSSNTLFIDKWLISELIKALKIKPSMVCNLGFASNAIILTLTYINLYFLNPTDYCTNY